MARWLKAARAATCGVALVAVAPSARAAPEPPPRPAPPAPPLVPPRAVETPRVPYPDGATGEAAVLLELTVAPDGSVKDVKVVDGKEPFASASVLGASRWKFEPARRGDSAVAARIRVQVDFSPPVTAPDPPDGPPASPTAPAPASSASARPAGAPSVIEDVEVVGARKEVGQTTLGGGEVRQLPGAFGDAFRAMEALPGVTPILSGLPFFYVRGAPPGNVGYYLDGVRVPLLYHLGLGPSIVHPGLVDHVDFYPGGFPARFGRFAGGILSGETRPPAAALHGEGNVRLIDTGLLIEAPIGKDVTALAAGRYSYTALLLTLMAAIAGQKARLDYWDYQTRVAWRVTKDDTLSVFAFGSYDYLGAETDGEFKDLFSTQFHRLDLRWDRRLDGGRMRLAFTLGYDATGTEDVIGVRDRIVGARFDYEKRLARDLKVRVGSDVWLDHYDLTDTPKRRDTDVTAKGEESNASDDSSRIYPPRNDVVMGAWIDFVYKPHPRVEVVPGARVDYFGSAQQTIVSTSGGSSVLSNGGAGVPAFDPRLATRVRLHPRVTSVEQVAVSHQPPSFFVPVPGLQIGRLKTGLQTALTLSQGFEVDLPYDFTFTPTVFSQSYLGLTDFASTCVGRSSDSDNGCVDERVRGRTVGLEVFLRRSLTKRFTGWLSYTLSKTTRATNAPVEIVDLGRVPASPVEQREFLRDTVKRGLAGTIPGEFDRRHVLNVIGAFDIGAGFRAGGRFVFYTGTPYSPKINGIDVPPYNSQRIPDFWRVDVRLEKRWKLRDPAYISAVIEWMNVAFREEAFGVECVREEGRLYDRCGAQMIGPITIPSIGLEGAF
ncbi:MAG: energy transducer TonB [Myxococcales bacterium]|nr:energy transducer TonB [Myxococcales bacterium]